MPSTSKTKPRKGGPNEYQIDVTDPVVAGILAHMRRGFRKWVAERDPEDQTPDSDIDQMVLVKSGREIKAVVEIAALARAPNTELAKSAVQALSPRALGMMIEAATSALKARTGNVLDAVSATDRAWFERHPKRRLYMRPVLPDELAVMSHAVGVDVRNHDIMLVGSLSESVRLRVPLRTPRAPTSIK